jgi:hypothetical protein
MSEVETRLDARQHMMRTGGGVFIKTTSMKTTLPLRFCPDAPPPFASQMRR